MKTRKRLTDAQRLLKAVESLMKPQNTPTPWRMETNKQTTINGREFKFLPNPLKVRRLYVPIESIAGLPTTLTVADCVNLNDANAAFIVLAVNSHEKMLEALRSISASIDFQHGNCGNDDCRICDAYHLAEETIAKAEGKGK